MMDSHTKRRAGRVCVVAVFTLLLVLFLSVNFDFYYDLNDDTMIKDILSGAYTGKPNGFCIQMLYPLGWFIALFYRAIPTVAWYGLFLCVCQFGVLALAALRLMSIMRSTGTKLMALAAEAAIALGLFLREFVIIQYSVTAGICMAGAVFLFLTAPEEEKPSKFIRRNLVPLMLVVLSFMIRTEVCIMLMPFLLLAGISQWFSSKKIFTRSNIKKYITLIGTALLLMLIVYSLDLLAYRNSEWVRFQNFFDARTKLYDFYGLPSYDNNSELYESIGLSRESYTLLENYNFALDGSIDTWRLEAIVDYQEQKLSNTFGFISKNSVRQALWRYKNQLKEDFHTIRNLIMHSSTADEAMLVHRTIISMMVLISYSLYLMLCIFQSEGRVRAGAVLKILGLLVIRSILWLYLYMVDRVLDRVAIPLLMLEFITIAGFLIKDRVMEKKKNTMAYAVYTICIVCALLAFGGNRDNLRTEYRNRAVADERWNALMDFCRENGNNYYVIDVYSSTSYNGTPYSEKIFDKSGNLYKNFDLCGGWAAKSPLAKRKLARHRFKDVQTALYSGRGSKAKKAYFIESTGKDLDWLVQYYEKRGMTIKPKCVDRIETESSEIVFDVYELRTAIN